MMVDSVCTIISAGFSLIGIFFTIIVNGISHLSFTLGWMTFWSVALILAIVLLTAVLVLKKRNLTRENIGINYYRDTKIYYQPKVQTVEKRTELKKIVKNFCPNCGYKLKETFRYCPFCGDMLQ